MKLVAASLGRGLLLAVLVGSVGSAEAGPAPSGLCCVCTLCTFSEHCFTGLTPNESMRCTDLCRKANCDSGEIQDRACETFTPLCEVITPVSTATHAAPVLGTLASMLATLGVALVGAFRLFRRRPLKTAAA